MITRRSIAILHFNPIELYPPVINLLNYLSEKMPTIDVYVFTNSSNKTKDVFTGGKNVCIERFSTIDQHRSVHKRLSGYFSYYFKTYNRLKKIAPDWVWYFETISALPAKWYFNHPRSKNSKLLIHYHEYMAPAEYENGPLLVKWNYKAERGLYEIAYTISHTNEQRIRLFLNDTGIKHRKNIVVFPNYPPKSWVKETLKTVDKKIPTGIVYVGAIGEQAVYIIEFCDWVEEQHGNVYFDIYSSQDTSALQAKMEKKEYRYSALKGSVDYENLPEILSEYEVGVILYKGHIPNFIYNAPNKLFEYWARALDVWFPKQMKGITPYARTDVAPRILPLDFEKLRSFDVKSIQLTSIVSYQPSPYYYEKVFEEFFNTWWVTEKVDSNNIL